MSEQVIEKSSVTSSKTKEFWVKFIADWKSSGLTQPEYCKSHNVKYSVFQYWRGALKKANCENPPSFVTPKILRSEVPQQVATPALQFQIKTSNATIHIFTNTNPALVKLILQSAGLNGC